MRFKRLVATVLCVTMIATNPMASFSLDDETIETLAPKITNTDNEINEISDDLELKETIIDDSNNELESENLNTFPDDFDVERDRDFEVEEDGTELDEECELESEAEHDGENKLKNETEPVDYNDNKATDSETDLEYEYDTYETETEFENENDNNIKDNIATKSEFKDALYGGNGKSIIDSSIVQMPYKITYDKADLISIDLRGLIIRYNIDDDTYQDIEFNLSDNWLWRYGDNNKLMPNPNELGLHQINVSYTGLTDFDNFSSNFPVTVDLYVRELESLSVQTPPTKSSYKGGEKLNLDGLVISMNYTDGAYEDIERPTNSTWEYKLIGSIGENYYVNKVQDGEYLLPIDTGVELTYNGKSVIIPITVSGTYTYWDYAQCSYDEDEKTLTVLRSRFRPESDFGPKVRNDCDITFPMKSSYGGNTFSGLNDTNLRIYNEVEKIVFDNRVKIRGSKITINGVEQFYFAAMMNDMPNLKEVVFNSILLETDENGNCKIDSLYQLFSGCTKLEKVDLTKIFSESLF